MERKRVVKNTMLSESSSFLEVWLSVSILSRLDMDSNSSIKLSSRHFIDVYSVSNFVPSLI